MGARRGETTPLGVSWWKKKRRWWQQGRLSRGGVDVRRAGDRLGGSGKQKGGGN